MGEVKSLSLMLVFVSRSLDRGVRPKLDTSFPAQADRKLSKEGADLGGRQTHSPKPVA